MNYQEHKEFFDGRHSKKNNFRNMKDKTKVTMDGDNVVLTYLGWQDHVLCEVVVRPDDHYYIHMPDWNQGGVMRIEKLTGVKLSSYKQDTIKESCRIWLHGSHWESNGRSVPWVDGVLYYGTTPVDLSAHVDYKRGFDPEKRLAIQRKVRDLSKVARVMAVLDIYSTTQVVRWAQEKIDYAEASKMLSRDGVTNALAEMVCGPYVANAKADWYYTRPAYGMTTVSEADQKRKRISAVKTALKYFSEALYKAEDAYVWNEVKP